MKKNVLSLFFVTLMSLCPLKNISYANDPTLVYETIQTEHFIIHFHGGLYEMAERLGTIAEDVYLTNTELLGWEMKTKVDVRIIDPQDSANGMASPSPYPLIEIYATPPDLESELQAHDYWLYTLFTHEFTHIIHLQMQHGIAKMINRIFGDVYLPNSMLPTWFIEGLAVMMETHTTSRGRTRSSYYQMVMRTHALEGGFQNLGEASNHTVDYPRGAADYIYGAMFMEYLRDRFGEKKIFEVCHRYASKPVPYFLNTAFKQATGKSLWKVYDDFTKKVLKEAEATKELIEKDGMDETVKITNTGESKGRPVFLPKGVTSSHFGRVNEHSEVLLPISDARQKSGLFIVNLQNRSVTPLVQGSSKGSVTVTNSGDIYYVRRAPVDNIYSFRELFKLKFDKELKNAKPERLTYGMRIKEAAVSKDGKKIAVVTAVNGKTDLVICDSACTNRKTVLKGSNYLYIYHPRFSNDGKMLTAVVREDEKVNLALINQNTGEINYLTDDDSLKRYPVFSSDGKYIFYDSDITGISNIFAINLAHKKIFQITNAVTGAAAPEVSEDGKTLLYLKYSKDGWDLNEMKISWPLTKQITPEDRYSNLIPLKEPPLKKFKSEPYNPLPTLRPHNWMLNYAQSTDRKTLTATSAISDAANLHSLSAGFSYEFTSNTPSFSIAYGYYGMLPNFNLSFGYLTETMETGYLVDGEPSNWRRKRLSGDMGFRFNISGLDYSQSVYFGYNLVFADPLDELQITIDPGGPLPEMPIQYFKAGISAGWNYSNVYSSPHGISNESGRSLYLSASLYNPVFGGDQDLFSLRWGWTEYFLMPFFNHNVLALKLYGGVYLANPGSGSYFSSGGCGPQNFLSDILNNTPAGLPGIRGYKTDSITGDHYHSLRAEYRFPIWTAQLAYKTVPLFFKEVHGGLLFDNLLMSFDPVTYNDWYASLGAELIFTFAIGYHQFVTLRTGYARGLMEGGTSELIFVIGNSF
ncbi:MAG: hypothetical protein JXR91_06595 [Deltaproteobacteria bacterium]|nr:hypothetical protein [Deltaproteobacteria bacterium]